MTKEQFERRKSISEKTDILAFARESKIPYSEAKLKFQKIKTEAFKPLKGLSPKLQMSLR